MKFAIFGRDSDGLNIGQLKYLVERLLSFKDVTLSFYAPFYKAMAGRLETSADISLFSGYADFPEDTSMLLSLGGDGTFLESLTIVRERAVPIAGINFGRLGFLTTAYVANGENDWIGKLIEGNYRIEERTLLNFSTEGDKDIIPSGFYRYALNEITIQRSTPVMLDIKIWVNGAKLPGYPADGILVGSATGSTAYSLSIGGPIVTPDSKVLIIAPIAPHNLNVRPIIVPEDSEIIVSYSTRSQSAILTVDNRFAQFPQGETLKIVRGGYTLKRVSVNNNFMDALHQKLLWGEDKRNIGE